MIWTDQRKLIRFLGLVIAAERMLASALAASRVSRRPNAAGCSVLGRLLMLEVFDLLQALLRLGLGFVRTAEILPLFGFHPVTFLLFHDHGGSPFYGEHRGVAAVPEAASQPSSARREMRSTSRRTRRSTMPCRCTSSQSRSIGSTAWRTSVSTSRPSPLCWSAACCARRAT